MRMSSFAKWFLISTLLLAAVIFAFIRISNAIDDFQMQMDMKEQFVNPQEPQSQPRPWFRDPLIRT